MSPDAERVLHEMGGDLSAVEWGRLLGLEAEEVAAWAHARRILLADPPQSPRHAAQRIAHLESVVRQQRAALESLRLALADAYT